MKKRMDEIFDETFKSKKKILLINKFLNMPSKN